MGELQRPARIQSDMKYLLRCFFNLFCLISLLVALAIAVVGIRSYWIEDYWIWYDNNGTGLYSNILRVGHGYVQYAWYDVSRLSGLNVAPGHYHIEPPNESHFNPQARFAFAGLRYDQSKGNYSSQLIAEVHLAWPFVSCAILPVLWIILYRRHRRRAHAGLCSVCGYDLRASLDRCPECGASPPEVRPDRAHQAVT
jgi:hypothetical protein